MSVRHFHNAPCGACGKDTLHHALKCCSCGEVAQLKRSFGEIYNELSRDPSKGQVRLELDRTSRKAQHEAMARKRAAGNRRDARSHAKGFNYRNYEK